MASLKTQLGIINFKQKILFPGCHQIDRNIAFENLKIINDILSKEKMNWGVAYGTLLGIIRDNDFIEWDEDIDLYILKEDEELFKCALWKLRDAGFELIRYERGGLYSIFRKGEYTDFYVLKKISNNIRYTLDGGFLFEKYLRERKTINFKGINLLVPAEVEEFFSFEYGEWETPIRYYSPNVNFFRRFALKMYCYFRLYAPDSLYFSWIKKLRSADLERFKAKCKMKGIHIDPNMKII